MILAQKLGNFIWQGDIYLTGRDIYFEKGHNFFYKFLGGQNFDYVYEP